MKFKNLHLNDNFFINLTRALRQFTSFLTIILTNPFVFHFVIIVITKKDDEAATTSVTNTYQFDGNGNDFREENLEDDKLSCKKSSVTNLGPTKPANLLWQFFILYQRYFMCSRRNCVSKIAPLYDLN